MYIAKQQMFSPCSLSVVGRLQPTPPSTHGHKDVRLKTGSSASQEWQSHLRWHSLHSATAAIFLIVWSLVRDIKPPRIHSPVWAPSVWGANGGVTAWEEASVRFHRSAVVPVPSQSTSNKGFHTTGYWTFTTKDSDNDKKVISRSQIKKTQRKLSQSLVSCGIKSVDFLQGQKPTSTQHLSAHLRQINNLYHFHDGWEPSIQLSSTPAGPAQGAGCRMLGSSVPGRTFQDFGDGSKL